MGSMEKIGKAAWPYVGELVTKDVCQHCQILPNAVSHVTLPLPLTFLAQLGLMVRRVLMGLTGPMRLPMRWMGLPCLRMGRA
jgi:hypothetical protein